MDFNSGVIRKHDRLKALHKKKAEEYGDTISEPFLVFSNSSPLDRIKMMIDTKLSRIALGAEPKEDSYMDLVEYIIFAWELEFPEKDNDPSQPDVWYHGNNDR